jgi:PAS domain S-box-containing protein
MAEQGRRPTIDVARLGGVMLDAARAAHIGVTVTAFDAGTARIIYASEVASEILGWPVEDLLALDDIWETVAPEDRARLTQRAQRRAEGETGQISYTYEGVRRDGSRVPIDVTTSHVTIEGRPAAFAFLVDASARKAAEATRLRTEASFRELIENAPEPIGILRDGFFVYANPAYMRALGFEDRAELYARPLATLVEDDEVAVQRARRAHIQAGQGRSPPHTYRARRRDGAPLLLEVSSVPFEYEGKASILSMARDVTAKRQLESQLVRADRLAALGTMAAGVAHEINNPLAYVMLNLEWVERKLPSVQHDASSLRGLLDMLAEAREGADRVATIVRELRSFSRTEGETRRPVELAEVVQSAIRLAGHEIRHRARIATSFANAGKVRANEARLEQVVLNLLLNASQAMPDDQAERNEIALVVRGEGELAVLEVADNGVGIAADVLPHIFDPFFTTKPVGVGTGLGLSICHGIVTALGGQITVRSQVGEGTRFRIALPTMSDDELAAEAAAGPASDAPASRQGPRARVLVVDDEQPIANTLRDLLGLEHDVTATTSAREALAAVDSNADFDVVFCDLMMPGMSGIELYERLQAERPGFERRIVFMTGGAFTARAAEFLASVDNQRIEKPFSLGVVERIVREMAEARARRRGEGP